MDFVEEINKRYEEYMRSADKPEWKYDDSYDRLRMPREFVIRMCRALEVTAGIAHKLHTLAHEEPEKNPGEHWGKLEVEYKYFAKIMQWDEKKRVRVVIDYDPDAEKVLLLRCPATLDEKEPLRQEEE